MAWCPKLPSLERLDLCNGYSDSAYNNLNDLDLAGCSLPALTHLFISSNYIAYINVSPTAKFTNLTCISANLNPFRLPIPSNMMIEKSGVFPQLEVIEAGIKGIVECVIWLLRRESNQQRKIIYAMTEE